MPQPHSVGILLERGELHRKGEENHRVFHSHSQPTAVCAARHARLDVVVETWVQRGRIRFAFF